MIEHVTLPARWRWKAERKASAIESERLFDGPFLYDHPPQSYPTERPIYNDASAPQQQQQLQMPANTNPPSRSTSVASIAPLRRSTRKLGLVKNPYIVKEAITLRAARNRVFALIDASEEAKRVAERDRLAAASVFDESGEPSLASLHVQRLLGGGGSMRSRSSTPIRGAPTAAANKGKKRRRHELEVDQTSERYEAAYGYGEKDGDDMDMERELEKEYQEIVTRLWIEGPATTGAVVSYMKARKRFLRVVALVEEWEAYKVKHGIKDSSSSAQGAVQQLGLVPPLSRTPAVSREGTPVGRRNLRPRVVVTRAASQVDSESPAKRQRRDSPAVTPVKAGPSSTSLTIVRKTRTSAVRQTSTFTDLTSASSESHEEPLPEPPTSSLSPPPVPATAVVAAVAAVASVASVEMESPTKTVVVRKRGRPPKVKLTTTTIESPTSSTATLPSPVIEGRVLRRVSTRAASASKSRERDATQLTTVNPEARSLRSRKQISYKDSSPTAAMLTS
ncbi:hypothetical protein FRB93_000458 [Tulasnella sp. JGI-2019a]|nr:hypothetical protein FRB93_000458 [Tulasnella sp. JGI-2019a]